MNQEALDPEIGSFVKAGEIATNVHDIGEGDPVVLLHGSGPGVSAWSNWRLTMPALAQRFRVVAPDIVGFGFSERPESISYDLRTWRRHLEDLIDALDLSTVSLVGNSFGGALALSYAIANPGRVERLVLMGSVGISFHLTPGLDAVWGYEPSFESMKNLLHTFVFDRRFATPELVEARLKASARPGVQEAYRRMFPAPRQQWIEALASDEDEIAKLVCPALVIHGRDDEVVPVETSIRLAKLLPFCQLHVFGRCGHWTQIEHERAFNNLVISFLTGELGPSEAPRRGRD